MLHPSYLHMKGLLLHPTKDWLLQVNYSLHTLLHLKLICFFKLGHITSNHFKQHVIPIILHMKGLLLHPTKDSPVGVNKTRFRK
jgi:hypothetical protein